MVQAVQKTMEIPQLQCIDEVIDHPVVQVSRAQVMEKTVEIPQLHVFEKVVEIFQFQTGQSTQTFESLGTAPVCQSTQAEQVEIVEAVEIGAHIPAESRPPIFVTAPVLEAPPVVVAWQSTWSPHPRSRMHMPQTHL